MAPRSRPGTPETATDADGPPETATQYRRWREFAEVAEVLGDLGDLDSAHVVPDLPTAEEASGGLALPETQKPVSASKWRKPRDTDAA